MRSCTHKVFSFTESWQKESKMTKRSSKQLTHRKLRAKDSERNLNLNRKCWEVALICTCAHLCLSLTHTHACLYLQCEADLCCVASLCFCVFFWLHTSSFIAAAWESPIQSAASAPVASLPILLFHHHVCKMSSSGPLPVNESSWEQSRLPPSSPLSVSSWRSVFKINTFRLVSVLQLHHPCAPIALHTRHQISPRETLNVCNLSGSAGSLRQTLEVQETESKHENGPPMKLCIKFTTAAKQRQKETKLPPRHTKRSQKM